MLTADIENNITTLIENRPADPGLWDGDKLICSPENNERITEIRKTGLENISDADVVFLFTSAADTVGTDQTFHYFLPEFFRLIFFKREFGYSTDVADIFGRLDGHNFQNWPKASQRVALKLCQGGAELEQEEHRDFYAEDDEDIAGLIGQIKSRLEKLG